MGQPGGTAGRRVALKDKIRLAGVPMMVGANFLDGSVPGHRRNHRHRILDEGGEIAGKAVREYIASGGSHTSSTGLRCESAEIPATSPAASSSGSAALVAASTRCRMAIGGD